MQLHVLQEQLVWHVPERPSALMAWSLRSRGLVSYRVRYRDEHGEHEAEVSDGALAEASARALAARHHGTAERLYIAVTATEVIADYREGSRAGTLSA